MTSRVGWTPGMETIGRSVLALGVFDGVHVGHQALLRSALADARRVKALAIAMTFDRDPDQIIHPEAAAPELLSLHDRVEALAATGVDVVLVVPFTEELARTSAEAFLDSVVGACCRTVSLHVGRGFRFGADATGDLDTLYVWAAGHDTHVHAHELTLVDGSPVSSTRIRSLVATGELESAAGLLGRPHRVRGTVHSGRGEGAGLGFATANITPEPHAALPPDGVYAGRALLDDDSVHAAAISVGTPPSFPHARDYVEAHLIDFTGDLYGSTIALEFIDRIRPQEAFASPRMLSEAIALDVARVSQRVAEYDAADPILTPAPRTGASTFLADNFGGIFTTIDTLEDGTPVVDDPLALEAAERAVSHSRGPALAQEVGPDWVVVFGPSRLSSLFSDGGASGALVSGPLTAAGIPFGWDPFPPEHAQSARPDFNWQRTFRLLVPSEHAEEARAILAAYRW